MTARILEIEGTWEEILLQADKFMGQRVKITILSEEESDYSPVEAFREAWQDIQENRIHPISKLWDGIDVD